MLSVKKLILRLLCIAFSLSLLAGALPSVKAQEERGYGYTLLQTDQQRQIYTAMAEGIADLDSTICFTIPGLTQADFERLAQDIQLAQDMVTKDHPEFFWFTTGGAIEVFGEEVIFSPSAYEVNGQAVTAESKTLQDARKDVQEAIQEGLDRLPQNATDYEISHILHDYLIEITDYVQAGDHQTAYGALVSGQAVCAGYARAYQLLMLSAGIDCWYVTGLSYDSHGSVMDHAWNLVWLDGECYYTDVTWDDQGQVLFHEYLNISLEEMAKTHFTSDHIPATCGHDDHTYFVMANGQGVFDVRQPVDGKALAEHFVQQDNQGEVSNFYCCVHYHCGDFVTWFDSIALDVAAELGMTNGYSYVYHQLGMEYHLTISGVVTEENAPTTPPPTETPTQEPTAAPTEEPTEAPTEEPTVAPTVAPTEKPTEAPTETPTETPTEEPTEAPTAVPTDAPTVEPTDTPTQTPTAGPSEDSQPATQVTISPEILPEVSEPATEEKPTKPSEPIGPSRPKDMGLLAYAIPVFLGLGIVAIVIYVKKGKR